MQRERNLDKDFQKVRIGGVLMTSASKGVTPIVFLENDSDKVLPIYIGAAEAFSIQTALEKLPYPRPLTHDLLISLIEGLNVKIVRIVVDDLDDGIFFARVIVRSNGEELEFDARPSDSIALAVRCEAPVYVANKVMTAASVDKDNLDK